MPAWVPEKSCQAQCHMSSCMPNAKLPSRCSSSAHLLHGGHRLAATHSSMSTSSSSRNASKVFVHALLSWVQVTRLGLEAFRQVQGEASMQLGLVVEGLAATLGLGPVGVLLNEALIDLPDGLLCGCFLKDGAAQV